MGNTKELILIHQEMKHLPVVPAKGFNILLSPQFYTLVREELPVKYVYEAKRIAPSLFEGLLEEDVSYQYFVEKEEEGWLFIAYSSVMIASFLEAKGIEIGQISKMYFAQQSLASFEYPMVLGDTNVLMNLNGTMTILPKSIVGDTTKTIEIDKNFIPKKGVSLVLEGEGLLLATEAYTLVAILLLFASIYVVEASRYGATNVEEEKELIALLEDYPSLESSYKRDSILSKYRAIDKKERMKREVIKSLSAMIFKGSILISFSLNEKNFQAKFECKDKAIIKRLKELAKKESFMASESGKNILKIEGTL